MKIGIVGCAGRMGQMFIRQVLDSEGCEPAGGTERAGSPALGQDLALLAGFEKPVGVSVGDDAGALFAASDAVIDFTQPKATRRHAELAFEHSTALVVGTTGLDAVDQAAIEKAAQSVPVVQAANMSLGVNALLGLVRQTAALLGSEYDIEVLEMHHRHKVDAPSGTALALGRAAADGRGVDLDAVAQRGRDGHTGARQAGDIGFAVLRGGDVVGDHTVVFAGDGERIEITHKAADRVIYARGAVRAALWTQGEEGRGREPGLYSMLDVLGLA